MLDIAGIRSMQVSVWEGVVLRKLLCVALASLVGQSNLVNVYLTFLNTISITSA